MTCGYVRTRHGNPMDYRSPLRGSGHGLGWDFYKQATPNGVSGRRPRTISSTQERSFQMWVMTKRVQGWSAQDLQGRRKGDPRKVRIAARLRRETTLTLEWIAERRCMGPARECQ